MLRQKLIQVEDVEENSPHVLHATGSQFILRSIREAPPYLHEPFILSGYRAYFSCQLATISLFRLHNQTGNIWTHLISFGIFLDLLFRLVNTELPLLSRKLDIPVADILCCYFFYFTSCCAMLFSSVYHLYGCQSEQSHHALLKLDLFGICLLIYGSFVGGLHYGFYCFPILHKVYIFNITVLIIFCIAITSMDRFQSAKYHWARVSVLALTVGSCVVPATHWLFVARPDQIELFFGRLLAMLALYLLGFVFYLSKFPERLCPGTFDIWGHSHQWWHICVAGAALIWENTLHDALHSFPTMNCYVSDSSSIQV